MNRPPLRTRIAPTPSGYLHMGNLYSFVLTWLIARAEGGTVRLRIDDLDAARTRPVYLEDIFRTLDFIGLIPDEGPSGVDDFLRQHSQKFREGNYRLVLNGLKESGHLYGCSCPRSRILADNPAGIYPGNCRNRPVDFTAKEIAWRVALPPACPVQFKDALTGQSHEVALNDEMGDFVVMRKDGLPAYQVASLADDLYYGINMVVRGNDLLTSTAAQLHLSAILGLTTFKATEWHHHPLIKNEQQQKLSKSAGDLSVRKMIENGMKKEDFLFRIAGWLGLPEAPYQSLKDLQSAGSEKGLFCLIR